eukprot:1192829-Rhodomonas_salina.1
MHILSCHAMSGTELGYGGTRRARAILYWPLSQKLRSSSLSSLSLALFPLSSLSSPLSPPSLSVYATGKR